MFKKVPGGSTLKLNSYDEDNYIYEIQLPPVGYGVNVATGELEETDIIKRSDNPKDQYWERTELPDWWEDRVDQEKDRQAMDPDYVDEELEDIRDREWRRRLCGVWFWNYNPNTGKSELQYVYGLHYFYMNWWKIDIGYPKFRIVDRDSFYILGYCIEDPDCLGLVEVTKRKNGKTYRAGCFVYEYISRTEDTHGGIQSKTDDDAVEMYIKAVMNPWSLLPEFFRPIFDTSKGDRPEHGLYFKRSSRRGRRALERSKEKALNSFIDYKNALDKAYDGPRLQRYVSDESGKLDKKFNIEERQRVVRYTTEIDYEFSGKHLYTTTVEDMESAGSKFEKVWKNSNPAKRDGNNKTATGLYRYFIPGFRTGKVDTYGYTDEEGNKKILENQLKALENDAVAWASHVRKNPPTIRHAFWRDAATCMYNATKLNRRREELSLMENVTQRGNFRWQDGIRDSRVIWEPNKNGRWKICWNFKDSDESNRIIRRGNLFYPNNEFSFISAIDPYQQDTTQNENRRSNAASYVLKRYNPMDNDQYYNGAFVCQYLYRPATTSLLHEDMIMQCVYFGTPILMESNKAGSMKSYFTTRGYQNFLIQLPGYKEPGIPSTPENKQVLSELTEEYIEDKIDIVYFEELIDSWLGFDIKETEKYDEVMGSGWTLVANMRKAINPNRGKVQEISDLLRKYKVKAS
jgi:hypothetical protein